jgi:hypothetical protein
MDQITREESMLMIQCARVLLGMKLLRLLLFLAAVPGSIELFHQVLNSGRGLLQIDTNGL